MSTGRYDLHVEPGGRLRGRARVPGDKSISHRAVLLGGIAEGETRIEGFLEGGDTLATLAAFEGMGIEAERDGTLVCLGGRGRDGVSSPKGALDLGNSGTAMRLLAGLLAGLRIDAVLTGDASLRARPMRRIIEPLQAMGARIEAASGGRAPLRVRASGVLRGIRYRLPMASAQVKSCILLAALGANGTTEVTEPAITRDHTERMLRAFGCAVETNGLAIALEGGTALSGCRIEVPGDLSSAAFFLVGASIAEGSALTLEDVGVNPTRNGLLKVLEAMGAKVELQHPRLAGGEPIADLVVHAAPLSGIEIPPEWVSLAIDEFPALMVAAAAAEGVTTVRGAEELRVKESDRIDAMADGLRRLGIRCQTYPDGIRVVGGEIAGGRVRSFGDHRVAMALAMAGLRAREPVIVDDCRNVATSFPGFAGLARRLGLGISPGEGR